jgi:PAS domain S-box-containing protein
VELEPQALAQLFWGGTDGIIVVEADGTITECNAAAAGMFGVAEAELVGTGVSALVAPRLRRALERGIRRFQASGTCRHLDAGKPAELHVRTRNGGEFPVHVTLHSLAPDRRPGAVPDAARGGHGRKRVCAVLREPGVMGWTVQREEAARLEGALLVARTAAHEINNALTPVVAAAELLPMRPGIASDPEVAALVSAMAEGAARAADWVARLQRITRIQVAASTMGPDRPLLDLDRSTS